MSNQNNVQVSTAQRPTVNDREAWKVYWKELGQSWRTEPEIDLKRQDELNERRRIIPDFEHSIYPFKDFELSRADIEWLLATHESGGMRGPVNWSDPAQRGRDGLDLRGAILSKVNLGSLPLARMQGGLKQEHWDQALRHQRDEAGVHLDDAFLWYAHLEGACLNRAHLERAQLREAFLEGASLHRAWMERAYLKMAHLEGANLVGTHLEIAFLGQAHLEGKSPSPNYADGLPAANLREAFLDPGTRLPHVILGDTKSGFAQLADVRWNGTNLALVDWAPMKMLGDEYVARQNDRRSRATNGQKTAAEKAKEEKELLDGYREAVRAYRQLAIALQAQGLNEEATHFAYRALKLQRLVLWRQKNVGQYLLSLFLDLLAGYGYKPVRSLIAYLVIILGFMGLYLLNAHFVTPRLSWDEALVLSVSSFHGRGFFAQNITLGDTYARLAAAEAVVGLLIEISFIATFTQRFFAK